MAGKRDAQDDGQTACGRRASEHRVYSRFPRAVAEAELTRFIEADLYRPSKLQCFGKINRFLDETT